MPEEQMGIIEGVAARTLSERENMDKVLAWEKENPERFKELLTALDALIGAFNQALTEEPSEEFPNIGKLQGQLKGERIPTQEELGEEGRVQFIAFVRALKGMNELMKSGETTKTNPYLRFHTTKTDTEALAVGAILHGYEELVMRHAKLAGLFKRDELIDGFVEVLSRHPENPLFAAVADTGRLNWIDGYGGFSETLRKKLGLS